MKDDIALIAPCGIHCGSCALYLVAKDPSLGESLKQRIAWNGTPCPGCRAAKGKSQFTNGECATHACITAKGHDLCFECAEYPCARLNPAADRAELLPHNLKVFNLSFIQRHGVQAFLEREAGFKQRYYRGRMVIGKGPQVEE